MFDNMFRKGLPTAVAEGASARFRGAKEQPLNVLGYLSEACKLHGNRYIIGIFRNGIHIESCVAFISIDVEEVLASEDLKLKLLLK